MSSRIVSDDRVLHAEEALGPLGALELLPAEDICRERLRGATALVVRSTTKIDAALLEGTRVRFVGTATVGIDHVDLDFLRRSGIAFASAAGSSAASVAQFTWCLILIAARRAGWDWRGRRLGVVGAGAIGERVARVGEALGLAVHRIDPPRREREGEKSPCGDHGLRRHCDLLSLHLPLVAAGPHRTRGLIDRHWLDDLPRDSLLVNTGRGDTAVLADLQRAQARGGLAALALDVWEGEPDPRPLSALGPALALASPHIAGRSREGLRANTEAIRDALAAFLGKAGGSIPAESMAEGHLPDGDDPVGLAELATELSEIDAALRAPTADAGTFRQLRDRAARRRDLSSLRFRDGALGPASVEFLDALRLTVADLS
jgi:erythronate-4-phosphate dehydrogenase